MNKILSKLSKFKKTDYIILLLIGVLILVAAIPTGRSSSNSLENVHSSINTKDSDYKRGLEEQLAQILEEMEGVGKVKVMLTLSDKNDRVEGVLILADGAKDPAVEERISSSVQALFGVEAHKIKIAKLIS